MVYKVMIQICNYHAKTTPTHSDYNVIIYQDFCGVPVSMGTTELTTGCLGYPMNVRNKCHTFAWISFFIEHYLNDFNSSVAVALDSTKRTWI